MERRPIMGYGCSYCSQTFVSELQCAQHQERCKYIHETIPCPSCDGMGSFSIKWASMGYDGSPITCTRCKGTGRVRK